MLDKIKLALAGFLIAGGFAGYYLLENNSATLRVVLVVAGCVIAGVIVMFTTLGRQFFVFSRGAVEETKKVVWPTGKETMQTTAVVFSFVVIMALFLWLVDTGLMVGIKALMGRSE